MWTAMGCPTWPLGHGQMTTGGLKLLGIGILAFVAAVYTSLSEGLGATDLSGPPVFAIAVTALLGTLVIALSANAVNLADLRPGRALKVGFVLLVLALLSTLVLCVRSRVPMVGTALAVALVGILLARPLLAMWPYDVRERGMLGDAGSNALGACIGLLAVWEFSIASRAAALAALMVLTGLSEFVSFSKIIRGIAPLRALDDLFLSKPKR